MGYLSDLTINITALRIKTGEKLNKLYADIGDKSQLTTSNKTNLVHAINELNANSAGFVKKTGDTMSGSLEFTSTDGVVIKNGPSLVLGVRDMGNISSTWARVMHRVKLGDSTIDDIGHFGSATKLDYGYMGGTSWNTRNAIRWTPDGKAGIGLSGTVAPRETLDVEGPIMLKSTVGTTLSMRDGASIYNIVPNDNNVASAILKQVWSANNVSFVIGGTGSSTNGSMSSWGITRFKNDRTANGSDGFFGFIGSEDQFMVSNLAGVGDRMVVTSETGVLKTATLPIDTTYESGTLALLNTGTSVTNMVWSPKTLTDWGVAKFWNITDRTGYLPSNVTDLNMSSAGQRGLANARVNQPVAGFSDIVTISQFDPGDLVQLGLPFRGNDNFSFRNKTGSNNAWSEWRTIYHSGNLTPYNLFQNRADLTNSRFYTSLSGIDANTIYGNVAFYTSSQTTGSNNYYHHQSWGLSENYSYQIRKAPTISGGLGIRTNNNGTWLPWENIAYESWVNSKFQNYYTKAESVNQFVGISNTQTIGGTKTFSLSPIVPTATLATHAINKGQMESWVTAQIAQGADSIWEHTQQGGLRIRNYNALATRDGAIAITKGGGATKTNAIGIGTSVNSDGNDGVVAGPLSANLGAYGTVVGPYSTNTPMEGTVVGAFLHNNQRGCTVTGRYNDPILNTTTNTVTDNSPLFLIGNGKAPSIRSNAYVMFSDGKGEFSNIQSYKTQHQFGDLDIPTWKFIRDNIQSGGSGSEDYVSTYGSQISIFSESKANISLRDSALKASGKILHDVDVLNFTTPTIYYLGNDNKWRKWTDSSNAEYTNITSTAVLGLAISNKDILLIGYYYKTISTEMSNLMGKAEIFHSFNKGDLYASSNTSIVERVFGYKLKNNIGYFNPWMFK